jgi:dienelactone hydrolase
MRAAAKRTDAGVAALALVATAAALALVACGGTANRSAARAAGRPSMSTSVVPPRINPPFDPETFVPPRVDARALVARFAYVRSASLRLVTEHVDREPTVIVSQVSYVAAGNRINALLVEPAHESGRHPAVVFAHGGGNETDAFLAEATALAKHAFVSVLPDIPLTLNGDATTDSAYVTDAVIAERRAIDLLVARPDVDAKRIAFVGHSWGAELAAILAGVEPRLRAVAIVCGWSRMATDMVATGMPSDPRTYMSVVSVFDGYRFLAMPGQRRVLIQYGRLDPNIPTAQRAELTRSTVGTKIRKDYDAGHDLVALPVAAADRLAFLLAAVH